MVCEARPRAHTDRSMCGRDLDRHSYKLELDKNYDIEQSENRVLISDFLLKAHWESENTIGKSCEENTKNDQRETTHNSLKTVE